MPINLSKGQKVDLTKGNPGLTKIMVGLGWDVNAFDSGSAFDLDAAAFLLGASGKCPTERDFIFYGNLKHSTGAVEHMGDNLTGEGKLRTRTPVIIAAVLLLILGFVPKAGAGAPRRAPAPAGEVGCVASPALTRSVPASCFRLLDR